MTRLIRNGRVIDPKQRIDAMLNVLIRDGKILALTTEDVQTDAVTDATGLVVCPGFIDMHAHEDPVENGIRYADEEKANLACLLRMGVTSCLAGNCGDNFCNPAEYLNLIDREGCFVNVAMLAGYTRLREQCTAADRYSPVSETEREKLEKAIREALDAGCAGVSFGLEYVPGIDREELKTAARLCAEREKRITAHIRACAESAPAAAEEILSIGKEAKIPVQLSHIGSMAGYGQMQAFLSLFDAYRADGMTVGCDCYPYTAFSTKIGSAPYDDLEAIHCRYEDIELCEGPYRGMRCTQELFEQVRREHPECLTVGHVMKESEIRFAYQHPNVTVGSDCFLSDGQGHPRAAGAFPRFLNRSASEYGLSLPETINRITALPAELLGLAGKGSLRPGSDADIVLFDPETIRDRASFAEPTLPPEGIAAVFIAGQEAVIGRRIVNASLGRAIRY